MQKNIMLIGFMGTGKSTVASYLCEKYGMDLVEMDELIAKQEGMSIPDIFAKRGEEYFRDLETKLIVRLQGETNKVVSCGGGVVLRERNVEEMKKNSSIVLLTAEPITILERVKDDDNRPLLRGNKNVEFISEMMDKRREKYEAAADVIISTDGKDVETICSEIMERVQGE